MHKEIKKTYFWVKRETHPKDMRTLTFAIRHTYPKNHLMSIRFSPTRSKKTQPQKRFSCFFFELTVFIQFWDFVKTKKILKFFIFYHVINFNRFPIFKSNFSFSLIFTFIFIFTHFHFHFHFHFHIYSFSIFTHFHSFSLSFSLSFHFHFHFHFFIFTRAPRF